jgi:hypothetical protein
MINQSIERSTIPIINHSISDHSRYLGVYWNAIIVGSVISLAIFILFTTFGAALGLSYASAVPGKGLSALAFGIASALWIVWTLITSLVAGCYFSGYFTKNSVYATVHEIEMRDGAHGLATWAIVSLVIAFVSTTSIAGGITTLAQTSQSSKMNPINLSAMGSPMEDIVEKMLRPNAPISGSQYDIRKDIANILSKSALNGQMQSGDKTYLQAEISARTGATANDASLRVDNAVLASKDNLVREREVVEKARKTGILVAFLTAATLLVGAAAAWWAAMTGGKYRDEKLGMSHISQWNYRKSVITQVRS